MTDLFRSMRTTSHPPLGTRPQIFAPIRADMIDDWQAQWHVVVFTHPVIEKPCIVLCHKRQQGEAFEQSAKYCYRYSDQTTRLYEVSAIYLPCTSYELLVATCTVCGLAVK